MYKPKRDRAAKDGIHERLTSHRAPSGLHIEANTPRRARRAKKVLLRTAKPYSGQAPCSGLACDRPLL